MRWQDAQRPRAKPRAVIAQAADEAGLPDDPEFRSAFDLSSYEAVRAHAEAIYDRLARRTMPCDGGWPQEQVALFRQWVDQGYAS